METRRRIWVGLVLSMLLLGSGLPIGETRYQSISAGIVIPGADSNPDLTGPRTPAETASAVSDDVRLFPTGSGDQPIVVAPSPTSTIALTPTASPTALVFPARERSGSWLDRIVAGKPGVWGHKTFYGLMAVVYSAVVALLVRQAWKMRL